MASTTIQFQNVFHVFNQRCTNPNVEELLSFQLIHHTSKKLGLSPGSNLKCILSPFIILISFYTWPARGHRYCAKYLSPSFRYQQYSITQNTHTPALNITTKSGLLCGQPTRQAFVSTNTLDTTNYLGRNDLILLTQQPTLSKSFLLQAVITQETRSIFTVWAIKRKKRNHREKNSSHIDHF